MVLLVFKPQLQDYLWRHSAAKSSTNDASVVLSWEFEPCLDLATNCHRLRDLGRWFSIYDSTPLTVSTILCGILGFCAWFILFPVLAVEHVASFVMFLLALCGLVFFAASQIDQTTIRILLRQFEFWYVFGNSLGFFCFAVWSLATSRSVFFIFPYLCIWETAIVFVLCFDAMPLLAVYSRLFIVITSMIPMVHAFVSDVFFSSIFDENPTCFLFCSTSRRLTHIFLVQVFYFFIKYLIKTIVEFRIKVREMQILRTSVSCQSIPCTSSPIRRGSFVESFCTIQIQTSFAMRSTDHEKYVIHHEFPFSPLLNSSLSRQISNSRAWQLIVGCIGGIVISILVLVVIFQRIDPAWSSFCVVASALIFLVEICRVDRTLLASLVRRFEYLAMVWLVILRLIFSPLSIQEQSSSFATWVLWGPILGASLLVFIILPAASLDAAPSFSVRLRYFFCLIYSFYTFIKYLLYLLSAKHSSNPICWVFCASPLEIEQSAALSMGVFFFKYFVRSLLYPKLCVILCSHVTLSLELPRGDEFDQLPSAENCSVELTDSSYSQLLDSGP